ncbi:MAG TPA: carboxypeptidase-like regulatory domain-containing protein [Hanamia sp.]
MLLVIFNGNLLAQINLTGTVKDSLDNPADNASVSLLNATNKQALFTQTDTTGHFSFKEFALC